MYACVSGHTDKRTDISWMISHHVLYMYTDRLHVQAVVTIRHQLLDCSSSCFAISLEAQLVNFFQTCSKITAWYSGFQNLLLFPRVLGNLLLLLLLKYFICPWASLYGVYKTSSTRWVIVEEEEEKDVWFFMGFSS